MKKIIKEAKLMVTCGVLGTVFLVSGCSSTTEKSVANSTDQEIQSQGEFEYKSVTIDNYDSKTTYDSKPERAITLSLNSAEIIAALGEADSITAVQTNNNVLEDVLPEYYEELKDVNVPEALNQGMPPTLESMLENNPDFVAMNSYYFYVPTFGTVEDYANNGVNLYITEGSYVTNCTIENTYNDIRNLGSIYNKNEEAENIIADMQARIEAVGEKVDSLDTVSVMAFDSASDNLITVAGKTGLENELISLAGGENVFNDIEGDFASISIEEIIERSPEVIIIHEYTSIENDAQDKIDYLKGLDELSDVTAIKEEKFIVINLFEVNPGIQNVNYIETVAEYLHKDAF